MAIFFKDGNPVSIDSGYNNQQQTYFPNNAVYYNGSVIKIRKNPSGRSSKACNDIMYYNNSSVPMQLIGATCNSTSTVYSSTGDTTISFDGRVLKNGSTTIATYSLQSNTSLDSVYIIALIQGGGGGGAGGNNSRSGGGGGGGGMTVVGINLPKGNQVNFRVGRGGAGGAKATSGRNGDTSFVRDSSGSSVAQGNGGNCGIIHETSGGLGGGGYVNGSHWYYGGMSRTKEGAEGGGASEAGTGLSYSHSNDYGGSILNVSRAGGTHGVSGGGGASVCGSGGNGGAPYCNGSNGSGNGGGGGGGAFEWLSGGYAGGSGSKGIIMIWTDLGQSL